MSSRFAVSASISAFACTIFQSSAVFGPPTWTPFSQTAASNTAFDTGSTVVSMICAMVATGWRSGPPEQAARAGTAAQLPRRHRFALPRRRRLAAVGGGRAESEDARLRAGLRLDPERRVVIPRDVDAAGDAHDRRRRIRAARFAIGLVALRIPP